MSKEKEQRLRRLIIEIRMMEGTVEALNQRLALLNSAITELRLATRSLDELKDIEKNNPLLVPIGGGTFVNATLGDIRKVIIGIGADVSVEMVYEDAVKDITNRLQEMEKAQISVTQQLSQVITQLESHQAMVQRLSTEINGAR